MTNLRVMVKVRERMKNVISGPVIPRFAVGFLVLTLSACVSMRDSGPAWTSEQREVHLASCEHFELRGKIAISQKTPKGRDGGSGNLLWQQNGEVLRFDLSAPLSNQTWRLEGMPGSYELTDSKGTTSRNASAEQLVFDASGWTIPVRAMRYWILALPSADLTSSVERNLDGSVSRRTEGDWQIRYLEYSREEPKRPIKIKATHPEASLTLVVKRWQGCK